MTELGLTSDPIALIPGSVNAVNALARDWKLVAVGMESTANALSGTRVPGGWRGSAADAFGGHMLATAKDASKLQRSLEKASSALTRYAEVLSWAQAQASQAIRMWNQAHPPTSGGGHGSNIRGATSVDAAALNASLQRRQAAQDLLTTARTDLASAGDTTAKQVKAATQLVKSSSLATRFSYLPAGAKGNSLIDCDPVTQMIRLSNKIRQGTSPEDVAALAELLKRHATDRVMMELFFKDLGARGTVDVLQQLSLNVKGDDDKHTDNTLALASGLRMGLAQASFQWTSDEASEFARTLTETKNWYAVAYLVGSPKTALMSPDLSLALASEIDRRVRLEGESVRKSVGLVNRLITLENARAESPIPRITSTLSDATPDQVSLDVAGRVFQMLAAHPDKAFEFLNNGTPVTSTERLLAEQKSVIKAIDVFDNRSDRIKFWFGDHDSGLIREISAVPFSNVDHGGGDGYRGLFALWDSAITGAQASGNEVAMENVARISGSVIKAMSGGEHVRFNEISNDARIILGNIIDKQLDGFISQIYMPASGENDSSPSDLVARTTFVETRNGWAEVTPLVPNVSKEQISQLFGLLNEHGLAQSHVAGRIAEYQEKIDRVMTSSSYINNEEGVRDRTPPTKLLERAFGANAILAGGMDGAVLLGQHERAKAQAEYHATMDKILGYGSAIIPPVLTKIPPLLTKIDIPQYFTSVLQSAAVTAGLDVVQGAHSSSPQPVPGASFGSIGSSLVGGASAATPEQLRSAIWASTNELLAHYREYGLTFEESADEYLSGAWLDNYKTAAANVEKK